MKAKPSSKTRGFSTIQLLITIAIAMIVIGFAIVGVTRARDHARLMASAREFAAYVEMARADAIRRHSGTAIQAADENTFFVTMDFDGDGTLDNRAFNLQPGVRFTTGIKGISFNWRGRIPQEESFGFDNGRNQVNVHVTGSGDVTFEAQWFFDASLPPVTYTGTTGGFLPDPSPSPGTGPYPSPTPTPSSTPTQNPSPTPTPTPTAYPTPTATPTPTAYPTPTATPTPGVTPAPTPTPAQCSLVASPTSLTIVSNGSGNVSVNRTNVSGTGTITATSSDSTQIQVSPKSKSVNGTAAAQFKVTVKRQSGNVTFTAAGCTSTTVNVTVR